MKPRVIRAQTRAEIFIEEGCFVTEARNTTPKPFSFASRTS